ncbi:MAG TPA: TIGR03086 family metal-binding protein [Amycolatopsis sp.]|jgi:uncharacterized protein (TIGR03086 family)|nr:TIGR03086 family metal-binding protein [Amycolatopsis sp.]
MSQPAPSIEQLDRALDAVGRLIAGVREDQWSAPTPCTEWDIRALVAHLVRANRVFVALLSDDSTPEAGIESLGEDPLKAYLESGAALVKAAERPGVLDRTFRGPLGEASGAERIQLRIADLLTHGWDLARATGRPVDLPGDLVEQALAFARHQLADLPRAGRFDPAQPVADDAPAVDRLAALLGRRVGVGD